MARVASEGYTTHFPLVDPDTFQAIYQQYGSQSAINYLEHEGGRLFMLAKEAVDAEFRHEEYGNPDEVFWTVYIRNASPKNSGSPEFVVTIARACWPKQGGKRADDVLVATTTKLDPNAPPHLTNNYKIFMCNIKRDVRNREKVCWIAQSKILGKHVTTTRRLEKDDDIHCECFGIHNWRFHLKVQHPWDVMPTPYRRDTMLFPSNDIHPVFKITGEKSKEWLLASNHDWLLDTLLTRKAVWEKEEIASHRVVSCLVHIVERRHGEAHENANWSLPFCLPGYDMSDVMPGESVPVQEFEEEYVV